MVDIEGYVTKGTKTSLWTAYRKLVSNHMMMKVELDMLELELQSPMITEKTIKKIIKGIELWSSGVDNNIDELDQARLDFRNRKIIEELDEKKGETLSALFG